MQNFRDQFICSTQDPNEAIKTNQLQNLHIALCGFVSACECRSGPNARWEKASRALASSFQEMLAQQCKNRAYLESVGPTHTNEGLGLRVQG